jgi:phosphoglycolate phosphatase-like HAD superfamily hydrolase
LLADHAVEHIVWDWNGTLFADTAACVDATIEAFKTAGLATVTREQYQRHHIRPISTFYDRLAMRALTAAEHDRLVELYFAGYARRQSDAGLTPGALDVLRRWQAIGGTQSVLSMHPHDSLVELLDRHGITRYLVLVDGATGELSSSKVPRLREHLARLSIPAARVLVVGDAVDDAIAARECGTQCVLYHAGEDASHSRERLVELGVPVVDAFAAVLATTAVAAVPAGQRR